MSDGFIRGFLTFSSWTALSRILGYGRDWLLAFLLGGSGVMDAFVIAFRLPNLFRRFLGEGAMNGALIPLYNAKLEGSGGRAAADAMARQVLGSLALLLVPLSVLAVVFMASVIAVLAPGFSEASKQGLTVQLAQVMFPYFVCMAFSALLAGVVMSHGRFRSFAAAPVLVNVGMIGALVWSGVVHDHSPQTVALTLAWSVLGAGLAQWLVMTLSARHTGFRPWPMRPVWSEDQRQFWRKLVPIFFAASITQLNMVIGDILATTLGDGAVAWMYFADRIAQLPLALVGVALGVSLLPVLSRQWASGQRAQHHETLGQGLQMALALALPALAGLWVLGEDIARLLFGYGHFGAEDVRQTGRLLRVLALGIPAVIGVKILVMAFLAMQDTTTPARTALLSLVVNVSLMLVLIKPLGVVGLGLATSVAAWVQVVFLVGTLVRRTGFTVSGAWLGGVVRYGLVAGLMAGLLGLVRGLDGGAALPQVMTAVLVVGAVMFYGGVLWALGDDAVRAWRGGGG